MKKQYHVMLPVEVDGKVYNYGDVAELDIETAAKYAHALMALGEEQKEEQRGRDS